MGCRGFLEPLAGGCPAASPFSLLRQKKVTHERRPAVLGPYALLRATCEKGRNRGSAELACDSDSCSPDPGFSPFRRLSQNGAGGIGSGEARVASNPNPKSESRFRLPQPLLYAKKGLCLLERSEFAQDPAFAEHHRFPVAKRRQQGRLSLGSVSLAKQRKGTCRRATPGQRHHMNKRIP
ncbi:MAG: hypothetical protein JWP47_1409 [Polaromonas sp.]|nr:hypothetical protein [Polaromonas sp.]